MNKYELNENQDIEFLEAEREFQISQEEDEHLTFEKRQAEAEDRERDLTEEFNKEWGG